MLYVNENKFIQSSIGLVASSMAEQSFTSSFYRPSYPPTELPSFTFFIVIEKDVTGTLKQVLEVGFVEIESAFSYLGDYFGYQSKMDINPKNLLL